jgi:inosine-uridine nucleoside N-ribohydrolase
MNLFKKISYGVLTTLTVSLGFSEGALEAANKKPATLNHHYNANMQNFHKTVFGSKNDNCDAKIPVIYFSDSTSFDDVAAMFLLCKAKNIDLKAVYITGNGFNEAGACARNVYNILDWLNHQGTEVVIGSFYPLLEETTSFEIPTFVTAASLTSTTQAAFSRNDGGIPYSTSMWGLSQLLPQSERHYVAKDTATPETQDDEVAKETIRNIIASSDEKVTIFSVGTLTGIDKVLFDADSSVIDNIEKVVMMGGAYDVPGNLFNVPYNTCAEFNIYADPLAAKRSFDIYAANNIPVLVTPLDATNTVPLTHAFLDRLRNEAETPEAIFMSLLLDEVAKTWFDPVDLATLYIWDATAAMALIDPTVITQVELNQGTTVVDGPASIDVKVNACKKKVTVTNKMPTNFGCFERNCENNVTIIKSFDAEYFYNEYIKKLNSSDNTAQCELQTPTGCYQYKSLND